MRKILKIKFEEKFREKANEKNFEKKKLFLAIIIGSLIID